MKENGSTKTQLEVRWLENIHNWCISRQLWWGHSIPAWVACLVMLGGDVPFSKVYLYPMICGALGRKMSKSFGNVVDTLGVINEITLGYLYKKLEEGNLEDNEV
ncbi:hypothetical protein CQW23_06183 [Capsicum baccatum]|uniref:valine--tRNA ligase n=1 Tax=Capsicum baccatum TaxID=33114 RepID=A0A2G2X2Q2_CAPBA|nr:hypothetical protein CQW23_06183 [Capsicum baccatum]